MSKYYIQIILLENCPYSKAALKLLIKYNILYKKIIVNTFEKERYKTNYINTFPQIFLKKKMYKGNILLGGYNDLKSLIINIKKKNLLYILKKYKWSPSLLNIIIKLFNYIE
jgi:glutaredoxin